MNISIGIPCLLLGGTEVATLSMVKSLAAAGHQVTVCCYFESESKMVQRFERYATVDQLKCTRGGLTQLFRLMMVLKEYFKNQQPDAVHVQYMAPGFMPILAARLAGVKHIFATVHAAGNRGYSWKSKLMFRAASLLTTHFFCVSENAERFWFRTVTDKTDGAHLKASHSTLYNGIDTDALVTSSNVSISGISPEHLVIGSVGRIVKLKGLDTLFKAFAQTVQDYPMARIVIIGAGPEEEPLKALAESLAIADYIIWCGRVEPEDLPGYYQRMDILAMPSHWEGFGLSAAEAMATGCPVVGTQVPGLSEVVVDGETGFLVPVSDSQRLAHVISSLLGNPDMRNKMGHAGRERVRTHFSKEIIDTGWQHAYETLLSNRQLS